MMNGEYDIRLVISRYFDVQAPFTNDQAWHTLLKETINHLILHDLNRLIAILYRLDIPEELLKDYLQTYQQKEAADIILQLILERETQKQQSRQKYQRPGKTDIPDDEAW